MKQIVTILDDASNNILIVDRGPQDNSHMVHVNTTIIVGRLTRQSTIHGLNSRLVKRFLPTMKVSMLTLLRKNRKLLCLFPNLYY